MQTKKLRGGILRYLVLLRPALGRSTDPRCWRSRHRAWIASAAAGPVSGLLIAGVDGDEPSVAIVDGRVTLQSSPAESSSNEPGSRDGPTDPADDEVDIDGVRINKRLGVVLSRREADRALIAGCVHVNGAVAESGQRVGPADEVRLDGELVRWQPADHTT